MNAQASTGPQTAHGRARVARNAFRHGLSLPARSNPALSEEVEALAHEIARPDATAEIQELARHIAEAQIDLRRVRSARHDLVSSALCDRDYESPAAKRKKAKLAVAAAKFRARLELSPHLRPVMSQLLSGLEGSVQSSPQGPQKYAIVLSDMTRQLAAMERYERRALSRRKFAIELSMRHEGKPPARASKRRRGLYRQPHGVERLITKAEAVRGVLIAIRL